MNPLDPFGLGRQTVRLGVAVVRAVLGVGEQAEPAALPGSSSGGTTRSRERSLDAKMNDLLGKAIELSSTSSRDEVFHHVLDQLVPDEARILSALSDGAPAAMVSVHAWTRAGLLGEALIENASLVGRAANVALPALTPVYVGHLLSLGVVETGPEDPSLKDDYQILSADTDVLAAIKKAARGPLPGRTEKRTLRISAFGRALWDAASGGLQ
ncbi:MAG TPA: Abi-alpha family protein [Marmoricola sp.]